jgi:small redox-active disulfide protein 2
MALFSRKKKDTCTCGCSCGCAAPANAKSAESPVKVLGMGCAKCQELAAAVEAALTHLGMDPAVEHVTDPGEIAAWGVISTPALVVDGKVVSSGRVLSQAEIENLLKHRQKG